MGIKLGGNGYNLREIAGSVAGNVTGFYIDKISNKKSLMVENI
jgi:outer membrane lipoprotein SlyB